MGMLAGEMYMMMLCNEYCCNVYVNFLCKLVSASVIGLFDSDAEHNRMCIV